MNEELKKAYAMVEQDLRRRLVVEEDAAYYVLIKIYPGCPNGLRLQMGIEGENDNFVWAGCLSQAIEEFDQTE